MANANCRRNQKWNKIDAQLYSNCALRAHQNEMEDTSEREQQNKITQKNGFAPPNRRLTHKLYNSRGFSFRSSTSTRTLFTASETQRKPQPHFLHVKSKCPR